MKRYLQGFISAMLIMLLSMSAFAATATGLRAIKAEENSNIKIVVNTKKLEMKDANGTILKPITYNGTTYLPVRAISDALGTPVEWLKETNTVVLGKYDDSTRVYQHENYSDCSWAWNVRSNINLKGRLFYTAFMYDQTTTFAGAYSAKNNGYNILVFRSGGQSTTRFGGTFIPDKGFAMVRAGEPASLRIEVATAMNGGELLAEYDVANGQSIDIDCETRGFSEVFVRIKTKGTLRGVNGSTNTAIYLADPYFIY